MQKISSRTLVNVTSQGKPHLGAALGSQISLTSMFLTKSTSRMRSCCYWLKLQTLSHMPHMLSFTHGFVSYLCRTILAIGDFLQTLEDIIRSQLIPALTGWAPPCDTERELLALPPRLGSLGIVNPTTLSSIEYPASITISSPLSDLVLAQNQEYTYDALAAQIMA